MAVVKDLVSALEFEDLGTNRFRVHNVELGERGVVFGGQLIAQIGAAGAKLDPAKRVKSVHGIFARPVLVEEEVEAVIDPVHEGRAFASCGVTLRQRDRDCARGLVLLTLPEPDLIRHGALAPDVASPSELPAHADGSGDREIRLVGDVDIMDDDAVGPPELDLWARIGHKGLDQPIGQGILAHTSASFLIGAAMRPHPGVGQSQAHQAISTGIIAHTISFHEELEPGDWYLLSCESTYAGRGRAYGRGQAFDAAGALVASFSQESMIRHFPEGQSPAGRESTIF